MFAIRADQTVATRPARIRVNLAGVLLLWLFRRLGRLVVIVGQSRVAAAMVTVGVVGWGMWQVLTPAIPLALLGMTIAGLGMLMLYAPDWYEVHIHQVARGCWRSAWVYRRRWAFVTDALSLTVWRNGKRFAPELGRVHSTRTVDVVRIRMGVGQAIDDWAKLAERLAIIFKADQCRVHSVPDRVRDLELWFLVEDPLGEVVQPFAVDLADPLPVNGLPLSLVEDGTIWRWLYSHLLLVGATGAGKSGGVWALILGLVPAVRAGLVKLWGFDGKGGVELGLARWLFDRVAFGTGTDQVWEATFADLLEDAVAEMRRRQDRMQGWIRKHVPSTDEPLYVLVIDELASITAWIADRAVKKRIETAMALLLSQGRAVGFVIVAATQVPSKETTVLRDLFPCRMLFRVVEPEHIVMTLGPGAKDRGADATKIRTDQPGVNFVGVDGRPEPIRTRVSWGSDDDITATGADWAVYDPPVRLHAVSDEETAA